MSINAVITGTGSYLPEQILTNDDLAKKIDTTDEWIRTRTGIGARHMANDKETTNFMAAQAAKRALEMADVAPDDIDLIVVGTVSATHSFPATACFVQRELGINNGAPAFDLQGACSGFIYALDMATCQIKMGKIKKALVIGAEKFTSYVDWSDRSTCVLFGDGAGAVVLEAKEGERTGVLATRLHADGNQTELLIGTGGLSSTKTAGNVKMQGREVYKHAVRRMSGVVAPLLAEENITPEDIDWLVPHQANLRIIEATAAHMNFPMEKVVQTVASHANTSAASVPLAIDVANREGRFKPGQLLMLNAFGAGFTWAGALIKWDIPTR